MALRKILIKGSGKKDNSKKLFAIFVGVVMLMSVAGFVFSFQPSQQGVNFRYGGVIFRQSDQGFFVADIGSKQFGFIYRPEDVSDINVSEAVVEKLTGNRVVRITYDWNGTLAKDMALLQFDISSLLDARLGIFADAALSSANPYNVSVATCRDATPFIPVLLLQEAGNTAIGMEAGNPDCIVLNATPDAGFFRIGEAIKYKLIAGVKK